MRQRQPTPGAQDEIPTPRPQRSELRFRPCAGRFDKGRQGLWCFLFQWNCQLAVVLSEVTRQRCHHGSTGGHVVEELAGEVVAIAGEAARPWVHQYRRRREKFPESLSRKKSAP